MTRAMMGTATLSSWKPPQLATSLLVARMTFVQQGSLSESPNSLLGLLKNLFTRNLLR